MRVIAAIAASFLFRVALLTSDKIYQVQGGKLRGGQRLATEDGGGGEDEVLLFTMEHRWLQDDLETGGLSMPPTNNMVASPAPTPNVVVPPPTSTSMPAPVPTPPPALVPSTVPGTILPAVSPPPPTVVVPTLPSTIVTTSPTVEPSSTMPVVSTTITDMPTTTTTVLAPPTDVEGADCPTDNGGQMNPASLCCSAGSSGNTVTTGTGDSSSKGVTALEYLGTGYHIFKGNPRGGDVTELDPGFRRSVIKMVNDPNRKTNNGDFVVPLGTELRYTTSCMFTSKSVEVATTSQLQEELNKEAKWNYEASAEVGGGIGALGSAKVSFESAYSESKKVKEFTNSRREQKETSFESKALCTEFEASLQRYFNHSVQDEFTKALEGLPTKFDGTNEDHTSLFGAFMDEYGTHYVRQVALGAKHVYSIKMKTTEVLELKERGINAANEFSAKAMMSASGLGVNAEASVGGGFSNDSTSNSSKLEESLSKAENVEETNIGGTPPSDGSWKTWAATAKDRPMPIAYELRELREFMPDHQDAYADYLNWYLENGQGSGGANAISDAIRYGVCAPDGSAISSYTLDPSTPNRAITRHQSALPSEESPSISNYHRYDFTWNGLGDEVSALFTTLIRENLSPSEQDREQWGRLELFKGENDNFAVETSGSELLAPVAMFQGDQSRALVAILKSPIYFKQGQNVTAPFNQEIQVENLQSFTFLTADNIPARENYKVGVIHPQGYAINRVFGTDIGFQISQANEQEYTITFDRAFTDPPTFIVSPVWFPGMGKNYPLNIGQVAVISRGCSDSECRVQAGADDLNGQKTNLGFNFLALAGDASSDSTQVIHGRIAVPKNAPWNQTVTVSGQDFTVLNEFSDDPANTSDNSNGPIRVLGGIRITFDTPFMDIPSVIATAEDPGENNWNFNNKDGTYRLTYVVVEHITTSSVYIKSSSVTDTDDTRPMDFSFVAIGPSSKQAG